jgi:hypothetical protein
MDFSKDYNFEVFRKKVDSLIKNNFLDERTAAVFVSFTVYSPYNNIWIYNHLMLERNLYN